MKNKQNILTQTLNLTFLYVTVSTLNPTVGIVVTDCPNFNLYNTAKNKLRKYKRKEVKLMLLFLLLLFLIIIHFKNTSLSFNLEERWNHKAILLYYLAYKNDHKNTHTKNKKGKNKINFFNNLNNINYYFYASCK